jgi:hypothetical protein
MFEHLSSKNSESIEVRKEECLENIMVNYHSSRESFQWLISDSFYSLYPKLFSDSDVHDTLFYTFPSQSDPFNISSFGEINFEHNIDKGGSKDLSLSLFTQGKDMSQENAIQLISDNIFVKIIDSILHIDSLVSSNFWDYTLQFQPIHFVKGNARINNLFYIMNPHLMCLPLADLVHQIYNFPSVFYDGIADWLEDSYLKKNQSKGKVILTLFLIENIGCKHDILFPYPL